MRPFSALTALCGLFLSTSSFVCADSTSSSSPVALPSDFKPAQVFKNTNLVRNTNLEKSYLRETINVVVENVAKQAQSDYYLALPSDLYDKVGVLEVRDKSAPEKGRLDVQATEIDSSRDLQYYIVHFSEPLPPSSQITLGISYSVLNSFSPRPAAIKQMDRQYLTYSFSAYAPSAYTTVTQKTKLKLPSTNVPEYTTTDLKSGADPERLGTSYTYGPYDTAQVAPGTTYPIVVRYEFTKPVITASLLERDLEVSHWGGNLATEERYWLRNNGSELLDHFSRVEWTLSSYQQLPSSSIRELKYPLKPGSVDPYFIDDIGNVSTSRYRPGKVPSRDASLELRPRFPIFGGWNYSFRVGWNNDLSTFLRRPVGSSDSYVLKVPFIEGPKASEGIQYEKVVVRVILPEGARNVRWEMLEKASSNGLPSSSQIQADVSEHKTFMDTLGRTALSLTINGLTDEARDSQIVVTYDYSLWDELRKPVTITAGLFTVFVAAWAVGNLDVSIKKR
ncbi:dolichyl-diphosphooligosaccharide--protein glycotransferase subunit OST1 [Aspergillus brunneoviolaceus CBS 621.78]|uniref:Oligosaccharyltransferase alpha subunit ostA n=1 Tax=Aspergillus brunneoviolaceus CBS 621.78 TaxID=1450534 RepID=A0ACD1G9M8_9EURO|nr:oligosaccharyltransferase alpha subunit ostA [Aspergillus brunneoviolaceus CBS 621.78]RAH45953.1 oligosaccharyltransferase alpha subunit ostA [Aspergillus brunneoviolaceus CBS 621.78]